MKKNFGALLVADPAPLSFKTGGGGGGGAYKDPARPPSRGPIGPILALNTLHLRLSEGYEILPILHLPPLDTHGHPSWVLQPLVVT